MATGYQRDLSASLGDNLPYLRRYARALTGSQTSGDNFAAATLEAVLADTSVLGQSGNAKVALFHAFHMVWSSAGAPVSEADTPLSARAQSHMAALTPNTREALLLNVIEGFSLAEIGTIMQLQDDEVAELIQIAVKEMEASVAGRILIIEDEAIIAMNLSDIVAEMGHTVIGTAATRKKAVELATRERPDLILADIQLADNSSGIAAVNDILQQFKAVPVIFITAFPERLLTGQNREPAFVITKPFTEEQVSSAVSQAMFFASTETL